MDRKIIGLPEDRMFEILRSNARKEPISSLFVDWILLMSTGQIESVFSVSELNRMARMTLERDLPSCRVRGEISNFSRASSGHWYFTLKDDQASVRCVMFRTRNQFVDWIPRDGDQIELRAQPTLYEARGDYQLLVDAMRKAGQGSLFEAFLRLKAKLEIEGLLSQARKREIPRFPRSIGIITSAQTSALRDVLSTINARWPGSSVILYPTPVQGVAAVRGLIDAIIVASQRCECDVLLMVRGGGSLEDLQGFNDEVVARTMIACPIPIIAGVGHETDFTIADFVADSRAPTPTGAAQLATPSWVDIQKHIQHLYRRQEQFQQRTLQILSQQLDGLRRRVTHPRERITLKRQQARHMIWRLEMTMKARMGQDLVRLTTCNNYLALCSRDTRNISRQALASAERSLHWAMRQNIVGKNQSVRGLLYQLELLSPRSVLRRGYSIVINERHEVLREASQANVGEHLQITLAHGTVHADVVSFKVVAD